MSTATRFAARLSVLAAVGIVAAGCTPSGYQAEHVATAFIHELVMDEPADASEVQCNEFTTTVTDVYTGICSVNGVSWAVTSTYRNGSTPHNNATISVQRWTGVGGACVVIKSGSTWVNAFCQEN